MPVRFEDKAVVIDDVPTFIYSGEFEYFRVAPEDWEDRIQKLKSGGLNCIGLYFAWNYHSSAPGQYDFTSPGCDIARLLEIVREAGLYAIVRPGPYICNEWDLGGYPSWLLAEDSGDWRSADPRHMRYLREWYDAVNGILARYQHDSGGPIILYQIENEYRWNDKELLDALYDYAVADGITVPLIGNHDGGAVSSGAKVTDGVDTYTGVGERYRWRGWMQAMYHRIGDTAPLMVLEFRGCDMSLWGEPAPSEERLPSQWIAGQEKLFTATGANLTNRFIAAGGITPEDFHSDHITTEYGTRAAVAPWGDVTASTSYAYMRMWGEFVKGVNGPLATSKPWHIGWGTNNPQVECMARRGLDGTFFTLLNNSDEPHSVRLKLPENMAIGEHEIPIGPGQIKVLVAHLKTGGFNISYSTAEILKIGELAGRSYIVLFGDTGTQAQIALEQAAETATIVFEIGAEPALRTAALGAAAVDIYAISTETAMGTCFLEMASGAVPLFGDVDLLLKDSKGVAQIETDSGAELTVDTPDMVMSLDVEGADVTATANDNGLTQWHVSIPNAGVPEIRQGVLEARIESNWTEAMPQSQNGWRQATAYGPGAEIMLKPGHRRWITEFDVTDPDASVIEFLGISSAECEFYLNGKFLGVFPEARPAGYPFMPSFGVSFDVSGVIHPGRNVLAVAMNVVGRHNCGQPIYSGFNAPVILRGKDREEIALPNWSASPPDTRTWLVSELSCSPGQAQAGYDRSGWADIDLTIPEAHTWLHSGDLRHRVRWYRTTVQTPKAFKRRPLFLETSPIEEAWVYVDGKCVERKRSGTSSVYDLSAYSERDSFEITIAVRSNWYFFTPTWGLNDAPKLVTASRTLEAGWLISDGAEGEMEGWAASEDGWMSMENTPNRDLWARRVVEIDPIEDQRMPIYVEAKGWGEHGDVYWNGERIGLYSAAGPQTRFYVPGGRIRRRNQMSIHMTGYGGDVKIGELTVRPYSIRRRSTIEVRIKD